MRRQDVASKRGGEQKVGGGRVKRFSEMNRVSLLQGNH